MSLTSVSLPDLADPDLDVAALTATLLDVRSVSGEEGPLADAVEQALRALGGLEVRRFGDAVVARTALGRPTRVILAGHLDTVPLPTVPGSRGTVPSAWDGNVLYGRGAVDMKSGVAVQLALAGRFGRADGPTPVHDVTWVFYDHEEVSSDLSGLARVARQAPELLEGDFAVLLEPTDGVVEGGCNGTCRYRVTFPGVAAHSGRAWRGDNAIHKLAPVLTALAAYEPATVTVEGLEYREGLHAIRVAGGVAGNVIPDEASVDLNYRFAPDKTLDQAHAHVRAVLEGAGVDWDVQVRIDDASPAARPGLDRPAAAAFVAAVGGEPQPKYGWTDVARFSQLGVPAVNFGPGDALLAHTDDEHVPREAVHACLAALAAWLAG
ncbi:succinyl-diaminopimelate desuccinylase [Micrococcus luteus]|uniref:succinyl-diaminopimelate desuccinylase n=1 Tax=Micrococcus luteus TaxID=1270 RepID=UPI003517A2D9